MARGNAATGGVVLTLGLALLAGGCKSAPVDDATLASQVSAQIAGDGALGGQPIQSGVQGGVATLSGTVANDAQRSLAARDAAGVAGVRTVVNNLTVASTVAAAAPAQDVVVPPPQRVPTPIAKTTRVLKPAIPVTRQPAPIVRQQAPISRQQQAPLEQASSVPSPPVPVPPATPRKPPPPEYKTVTVESGTVLPVRVTQTLDSATTQQGQTFSGTLATDVMVDGLVAIPSGSTVSGRVDAVQEAAHFKGSSLLTVSLTGLTRRGERLPLTTEPYTVEGKGRGKNTAAKVGGGAAVGAILGGILGGGKGAAIGAATGGGVGAGANTITRGEQVQIASESIVRFRTTSAMTVRVRGDAGDNSADPGASDPSLQRRNQQ